MKTVIQALQDEIYYPIPTGKVEVILIKRGFEHPDTEFNAEVASTASYKGALADCLISLLQAVNFSEADKSVGALTDAQRKTLLKQANELYGEIGEPEKDASLTPTVVIMS